VSIRSITKLINHRLLFIILSISLFAPFIHNSPAKAVASCAPVETIDGLYTVQTFSNTGTCQWSVPTGITSLDSLVVAGGGGGGGGTITYSPDDGAGGGGGGAGQVVETTSRTVAQTQVITIVVGAGGNGASGTGRNYLGNYGYPGGNSSISLAAGWSTTAVAGGGSISDASKYNLVAWGAGRNRLGTGSGTRPELITGGYGGGSGNGNIGSDPSSKQAGQGASDNSGVTPGASTSTLLGVSSSISGTAVVYANGGGGGNQTSFGSTESTYGSGGGGGKSADVAQPNDSYGGYNGLSGVVIVRYLTYVAPPSSGNSDNNSVALKSTTIDPCAGVQKVVIYFDGGKFNLDKADKTKINNLVTLMNSCSFTRINLSGFTSIDKADSVNYALFRKNLSLKRAKAVEKAMFSKLSKKNKKIKVKTKALSNSKPVKANNSEKNRASNRRVEITVY
jgi:outer membrane protein OmpA-like peptidoglycan-associated protein